MKLPQYVINDCRQILQSNVNTYLDDGEDSEVAEYAELPNDYQLEFHVIMPIYRSVFRYLAAEVLKNSNIGFAEVIDRLAGEE